MIKAPLEFEKFFRLAIASFPEMGLKLLLANHFIPFSDVTQGFGSEMNVWFRSG